MVFNDTSSEDAICQEIDRLCGSNTTSYTLKAKAARVNQALDRFFTLAFQADGRWSFDDINNANPPIDTQNIVSGTNKYKIGSFTEKIINILKLEVLDSAGNAVALIPERMQELNDSFGDTYKTSVQGTPSKYLKLGDFIYLRDTPNYNSSGGLKAYFNRPAAYFVYTDTTKVAGIPLIFHLYLARHAAQAYLIGKQGPAKNDLEVKIAADEKAILAHFSRRDKTQNGRMTARQESNR